MSGEYWAHCLFFFFFKGGGGGLLLHFFLHPSIPFLLRIFHPFCASYSTLTLALP
jgi:hypothetical protein